VSSSAAHLGRRSGVVRIAVAVLLTAAAVSNSQAQHSFAASAPTDPIFVFSPVPPPSVPETPIRPPPNGYLNDPCGLAVDSAGNFYIADYYHDVVDVYRGDEDYVTPPVYGSRGYLGQLGAFDPRDGPCGLALGNGGELYVNSYHQAVRRYGPFPAFSAGPKLVEAGVASTHPTGVAVDPANGDVYVNERTYLGVYEPSGAAVEKGGLPLRLGAGTVDDGYGVAVSAYPATAGFVYVPDAASDTVKVFNPAADVTTPVMTIAGPPGGFSSLRDSAVAVDRVTGDLYVVDDLQPADTESPHGLVDIFDSTGAYEGHLKYEVVDSGPAGLAVDNSAEPTQGRVYVTSGNTHHGGIYAYLPGAATTAPPLVGTAPPQPLGGTSLFPVIIVGEHLPGDPRIPCEGDACQILPPQPEDPPLATLATGAGNPHVRYERYLRRCRPRSRRHRAGRRKRGCHRGGRASLSASVRATAAPAAGGNGTSAAAGSSPATRVPADTRSSLPAVPVGFDAHVWADGGEAAGLAGSHPYALSLSLGQGPGGPDLRNLGIDLPPGLLLDPAAAELCAAASFSAPRSSPFEASSSGESCPGRSQVGTVEAEGGGGEVRRFGLFDLYPAAGAAARLAAAPFGTPVVFDVHLLEGMEGSVHFRLEAADIPPSLDLRGLTITLWGTSWDASHNGERDDCLNEVEPSFPWAKCSGVGEPLSSPPLAFLTLPTHCDTPLAFTVRADLWSGAELSAEALNRDSDNQPVPVEGCTTLDFEPGIDGGLSTKKVTSPSGFVFRLTQGDMGFVHPRRRGEPRVRSAIVQLPPGVTLNPSLGAGLEGCTLAQFAAESALGLGEDGCPNGAKIGTVSLRVPFYKGELKGAIYLAQPGENPYGSLLAVYLVVPAPDRGILLKARGELLPDPADGTLTARFDGLSQIPYSELRVSFRSSQRAPFVSPSTCARTSTRIEPTTWAEIPVGPLEIESPLEAGIDDSPCPTGTPPFQPTVVAGAVNSNVNSYTPYAVHISRRDSEQEITSYSLVLPKGITGKLAGIPFCPDAEIAAARENRGFAEAAHPSCPKASQVGRTVTGYGVGPALAYSEGKVYLAGPYHGAPLSLVTINPATVGPFDVGTIVVRSAFDLDPRTAQLRIDSRGSDPIPHIIDGIVLHVRDIRVYIDRPDFTHNPSSCEPSQLVSTLTGSGATFGDAADDSTATASQRFQLLNCRSLGFRPKLGLRLRGPSRRGGFPALRATFAARGPRDSNLSRIEVDMPHQLFLAQNHIRAVCTGAEFAAERCPPGSAYGTAVAYTPLLDDPLRGKVYLRSSSHKLPDLVADLRSGSIRIELDGSIGPTKKGGIRVFFANLPDAPIERFTMLLWGGRRGLLTNSVDVCRHPPLAAVKALGQNNVGAIFTSELRGRCSSRGGRR
jgi:DNA-binding beta-propeller fold protein YncE